MNYFLTLSPLIRVVIPFGLGILIANSTPSLSVQLIIPIVCAAIFYVFTKSIDFKRISRGVFFFCLWSLGGSLVFYFHTQPPKIPTQPHFSSIEIDEIKSRTPKGINFIGHSYFADSKVRVYGNLKDAQELGLRVNDKIAGEFNLINPTANLNPNTFDFKNYLEKQNIHFQVFINPSDKIKVIKGDPDFFFSLNALAKEKLNRFVPDPKVSGILKALILGDKTDLDKDIKSVYASVGAMHVLAVSGLHVGIIMLMITFLTKFLEKFKYGPIIQSIIVIAGIWIFAGISGFSVSVCRASLMFSFISIGRIAAKNSSVFNSIAASALILLIINPNALFDVGFQLSYSAVIGILVFQPIIYSKLYVSTALFDWLWKLTTVSISATLGTLPFTLFYFGFFPLYFMLTNLIVIPLAGILIGLGLGVVVFSVFPKIAGIVSLIVSKLVGLQNSVLTQIADFNLAKIDFTIDEFQFVIIVFLIIILGFLLTQGVKRNVRWFCYIMGIFVLYSNEIKATERSEDIIFHPVKKGLIIQARDKNYSHLYSATKVDSLELLYSIMPSVKFANNDIKKCQLIQDRQDPRSMLFEINLNQNGGPIKCFWTKNPPNKEAVDIIQNNNAIVLFDAKMRFIYKSQWKAELKEKNISFKDLSQEGFGIKVKG